ncbi:MAG: flippase-like domain-containing protein [Halobacteriaceae archaeon]
MSLVVPAHNEEGNLRRLVDRVLSELGGGLGHDLELVLVDDNSTDRTAELCDTLADEHPQIRVVHRDGTPGFGNALKAGLQAATGDILVPFMGDLSDDPADVKELVAAIEDGADFALGSRFVEGGTVEGYPPLKLLYNRLFNNSIRVLFGIQAKDVTNAFTAYRREVIEEIGIETIDSESFDITVEIPLRAHILGFQSAEVPVSWRSRDEGVSKLNATKKGPVYGKRLLQMFVLGNVTALGDLYDGITTGSPLRAVGAVVFAALLLVGLFSVSGFQQVLDILAGVRVEWLALGAVGYFVSFLFRTWRYRVLLRATGALAARDNTFRAIMANWFANFLLPARVGDLLRGVALKATDGVPFGAATGMVAVERVLDMLVIGTGLVVVGVVFVPSGDVRALAAGAFAISAALLVLLGAVYAFDDYVVATVGTRFPKAEAFVETLDRSLERVAGNWAALLLSGLLTVPVWVFELSTFFFSARAVGLELGGIETVAVGLAAFIAQAVPLTPAGIGTFETTVAGVLGLFGVETDLGTAMALTDHFVRLAVVYIFGAISVVHIGFRSRVFFRERRTEAGELAEER